MKRTRWLAVGLGIVGSFACHGQNLVITNGGWYPVGAYDLLTTNDPTQDPGTVAFDVNIVPLTPPNPPSIAEVVTPELQALADGLQDDPVRIFNYVHDHIRYVLYWGSQKGAQLTLLEKSGNDFDQCALLVALLRAAGYTNAAYQFGWMSVPFDNPDGSHRDLHHWLCLNFSNSNWSATSAYLKNLFQFWRSYPHNVINSFSDQGPNTFAFQRVWVTLPIGGTTYYLDPGFKVSEPISGISLTAAMGDTGPNISNALMSAAGGLEVGSYSTNFYATNLNEAALDAALAGNSANLLRYLQSNYPNASVEQILGGQYVVPSTNTTLSQGLLFPTVNMNGTMPVTNWVNEPTNIMFTLKINFASKTYQWFMPQLQGQRLALTHTSSTAQLWQEDTNLAQGTFSGYDSVTLTAYAPDSNWDITNNVYVPGNQLMQTYTTTYYPNSSYAITYAFEPDWGWLRERQQKLESYRQQGLSDTSRQVVTETLNVMGMNWQMQVEYMGRMMAQQTGVLPMYYQRIGRMAQESGRGYYVDVYMASSGTASSTGQTCDYTCDVNEKEWFDLMCYFASAMEHGMIEQLQSSNLVAASAVKMLEMANSNHQAVYLANSTNWSTVETKLTNYTLSDLTSLINQGYQLLLPQNGSFAISSSGSPWTGYGFLAHLSNGSHTQMLIGPGKFGGYASDLGATIDPTFIDYWDYSQPLYFSSAPPSVPNVTGADPVNMADGTFQVQATDLSLGRAEPRGLNFSRYYSSSRRNSSLAGIAPGWIHNYYLNAATVSAPQVGLGGTTPAQMAPMLTALGSAICVYNGAQAGPKNWLVTALIAKWGIDQLTGKAVSVNLGKDTIQFIQQPDGSYTPPANSTMTLLQTNSGYWLQERHGRTFKFNPSGWATNISDQYNQSLSLAYNSSNWVTSVTDWKGRSLTFNYSTTTPKRLTSVADSASRTISLGYSSSNDLASVTDPEGKTNSFRYDTNHQITATFDALGQVVASNIYNGFGRVTKQFTQGDPNKTWKIFWSGWQTVSQDPAGGKQTYFYDDKTRLIAQQDALGNLSQTSYDGQDHTITRVSPLNETNQFIYDGNHNLVCAIDPLGFSNQFFYDSQNNLVQTVDGRGNVFTFGYNNQFSLTGQTNGAGDWISYAYNSDGTLHSRSDSGGTNTYGYDSLYGQLNSIIYPNSLGSESFGSSSLGDITSHTDGNGNITTFSYNNRRQLTNSVAPTNLVSKVAYDPVGNAASATDPRGNVTSNTWSATRHLLATTLPATPQGVPVVTNVYDNRDWLVQTLDPLRNAIQFTNDFAGRLTAMTDPLSRTTTFGYDPDSRAIALTNAAQEVSAQTWDARGKLIQLTDGAAHTSSRAYDAAGNQITLTNRNANAWQFQFDGANRLTNTISPLGRSTSVAFNHQSLPASIRDPAGQQTTCNYDARGRLTSRADSVGSTLYSYDANNNCTSVAENGLTNAWTYDAYNQVSSYKDVYGNLLQYRYDANGNLTNLVYPGGRTVVYSYDSLNRLTNVTDWAQRKTTVTYDLAGRVTSVTRPNGTYRTMSYDAAGQLTNIWEQMGNTLPIAWFRFNWANSGSMGWEFAAPLPHTNAPPTRTMTYDADNRLASFNGTSVSVDTNGNMTYGPLTNSTFNSYAYDPRNRLLNVGGVTNVYDAANNRIGQAYGTNSTVFVVNPSAKLPQVLMRIKNGVTNYYVYGLGLLYQVTETASATNTLTYHYDYRGSTIALSDSTGLITDRIEYSLYGLTTYGVGTNDAPFLFNGRYGVITEPTRLLYMRARYYNPYLCRFLNPDPSGFGGGLNFYAYANGNPVTYLDPFGLGAIGEDSVASWVSSQKYWDQQSAPARDQAASLPQTSFEQASSTLLNMLPVFGGLKQSAESIFGSDFVTGQQIDHRVLYAAFGLFGVVAPFLGPEEGAAQGEVSAAETTAGATRPFAMGLDTELDAFAQARGATTWKQFPNAENWKSGVLDKLADPNTPVHFNLNGVDIWGGVQRAASGGGGATDWELLQIRQNPQFWDSMTFWKNGQVAPNPFK